MSLFDDIPQDGESEEPAEPDAATIAFLDQQQAEFEGMEDEFLSTYGFEHHCHCGEDYAAGRVGEITQCYHNMMQEALATCAKLNAELKEVTGIAKALYSELTDRIAAESLAEGSREVSDEPAPGTTEGVRESTGTGDITNPDAAAADAAGEGLGSAAYDVGAPDETGDNH